MLKPLHVADPINVISKFPISITVNENWHWYFDCSPGIITPVTVCIVFVETRNNYCDYPLEPMHIPIEAKIWSTEIIGDDC